MSTIISCSRTDVSRHLCALVLLVMLGSIVSASAQVPIAVGAEFRVNSFTADSQVTLPLAQKSVAMDSQGNFVVTWTSYYQDQSKEGVYAQRYNSAGMPQGPEFKVNSTTMDEQLYSAVAMDSAGNFVITWTSYNQDSPSYGVFAQQYNSAGVPQGPEFIVNSFTIGDQMYSSVAMDATGNFVITWSSLGQDGSGNGIYARRYNAAGAAQGGEFKVNTTTVSHQQYSAVAMDPAGNYVITWQSGGQDGSSWGIYAQRYNASGAAQGPEFKVNTTTINQQQLPSLAMDATGNFVITWMSMNQDGSGWGIYAQLYNSAGVPQGAEFKVNTTTINDQQFPSVAMAPGGNFIITWSSDNQDGSYWGVYAQSYSSAGVAQGGEFIVNTYTTHYQRLSNIATNGTGVVIAWTSTYQDGSNDGVYAQRYTLQPVCVEPPNTTMIAWYPFDEPSGMKAENLATGNTGTLGNSPLHIPGKVAGALRFDGYDDYVESPSTIVTNIGPAGLPATCSGSYSTCRGDFSIDTWIRMPSSSSNLIMIILEKEVSSGSTLTGYSVWIFNGYLILVLADGGAGNGASNYTSTQIPISTLYNNQWHHIAVTVSRRGNPAGIKWYFNGVLISTNNPTIAPTRYGSLANSAPLRIGSPPPPSLLGWLWFKGDLDEVEIFNRELTQVEVKAIFAAGTAGKCKP